MSFYKIKIKNFDKFYNGRSCYPEYIYSKVWNKFLARFKSSTLFLTYGKNGEVINEDIYIKGTTFELPIIVDEYYFDILTRKEIDLSNFGIFCKGEKLTSEQVRFICEQLENNSDSVDKYFQCIEELVIIQDSINVYQKKLEKEYEETILIPHRNREIDNEKFISDFGSRARRRRGYND